MDKLARPVNCLGNKEFKLHIDDVNVLKEHFCDVGARTMVGHAFVFRSHSPSMISSLRVRL